MFDILNLSYVLLNLCDLSNKGQKKTSLETNSSFLSAFMGFKASIAIFQRHLKNKHQL